MVKSTTWVYMVIFALISSKICETQKGVAKICKYKPYR